MTVTPLLPGATASLRFEADYPIVLADIRAWTRQLASPSEDLELLVTELMSNARDHGERGTISLSVGRNERTVTVVVSNTTPSLPPPIPPSPDAIGDDQIRGRGLLLASAVTDHLAVEQFDDTLTITAQVPLW